MLGDILIIDVVLLVLSLLFGAEGFILVLVVEIIYTVLWIGGHM